MRTNALYTVLKATLLAVFLNASCAKASEHGAVKSDAVQALLEIVKIYHKPVIGEFIRPIPSEIVIDQSGRSTVIEVLTSLASQCPGYIWFENNGVIVFGNEKLLASPGNPMNIKLPSFTIPETLGDFKISFPGAVQSARKHIEGVGGVGTGLALPASLSPRLRVEEVKDMDARAILIRVAAEVGQFFSAIILPLKIPPDDDGTKTDFIAWDIVGGPGIESYKTFLSHNP